jgi:hypothetical protein
VRRLPKIFTGLFERRDVPTLPPPQVTMSSIVRDRMNRALRRRLSDRVMAVFQESCIAGDLATAEELLEVMEGMHQRRQSAMGDRRLSTQDLEAAQLELKSRKTERIVAEPVPAPAE